MSGSYISKTGRRQQLLLPDMIENYIEEDNPARFIDTFVETLDMHELGFKFSTLANGAGRPSYNPKDMLKLYLWGYFNGIRSSRKLKKQCCLNMEVMWLLSRLTPDFKSISDFRKDNIDCMKKIFTAFNKMCMEQELFGRKTIGIDGTKVKANNARDKTYTKDNVDKRISEMEEKADKYLKEIEENDNNEEDEPEIANMKEKIETLKKRTEELKEIQKKMVEKSLNEISLTDPEAKLMKTRTGIDVCYNTQISVDDKHHLIVEYEVNGNPTDCASLIPMSESSGEMLETDDLEILADKGYFSANNIKALHDKGMKAFIPEPKHSMPDKKTGIPAPEFHESRFKYNKDDNTYACPQGNIMHFMNNTRNEKKVFMVYGTGACAQCPVRSRCTASKKGRRIYRWEDQELLDEHRKKMLLQGSEKMKKRKALVEHPFGTIKRALNSGYTLLKGTRKVSGEFGLMALAYNMKRVINIRSKKNNMKIAGNNGNIALL
ncbi:MAG: IS1182 family transposase [Leptospirales bacterium]